MIAFIDRDTVIKQTVQNMIEAGVVKPDEYEMFTEQLYQLDPKDLVATLLESHNMREQAQDIIRFYPIGEISKN